MTHPTSNQDLVAELEAAAAKWVLEKNKYTLEVLRDARAAVLKQMTSGETAETHARWGQALAQLTNGFKYSAEVCGIAREALGLTVKTGCSESSGKIPREPQ